MWVSNWITLSIVGLFHLSGHLHVAAPAAPDCPAPALHLLKTPRHRSRELIITGSPQFDSSYLMGLESGFIKEKPL